MREETQELLATLPKSWRIKGGSHTEFSRFMTELDHGLFKKFVLPNNVSGICEGNGYYIRNNEWYYDTLEQVIWITVAQFRSLFEKVPVTDSIINHYEIY